MRRRVGLPAAFSGQRPGCFFPVASGVPERFFGRGRWQGGALHTFVDDYRQEFFWRRPEEGRLVASVARIVTAPDFTVYTDDPPMWREYQAWRSQVVAGYWSGAGVLVLPVVSFRSGVERFVPADSTWAVRGPAARHVDRWLDDMAQFVADSRAGRLVVFGRVPSQLESLGVPVLARKLLAATKGG